MHVNKTIFLVDDNEAICNALSMLLEGHGYRVMTYQSAELYLEVVKDETEGVLLLDQRLIGMTGLELQAELTRRSIVTPIIFITGHLDNQICAEAVKAGAINCLFKPFSTDDLLESVTKAFSVA